MNDDSSAAAAQRKRLYWHSRRGMWELDLLLIPFLEARYDDLEASDQAAFRALLEEEDQDLFAWMMRREWPEDPERRRIVQMIVEHAESTDNDSRRAL
ncbi:succinate dehydrogenase assembly factor 2 [Halomonas beimenensis]|uniref:FAD assembly factor SdhE n=1 Tax=Halomonas beimenensis TaxID=475662 RepID=A0A291P6L0_9GAMM|nr:succinate dehydrogenase assembly factor 2 [Halomonas beimenensis]ATJ82489.1 YgfY [Halomonas beimenensis]